MVWDREQYIRHMTGGDSPRQFFACLFGPLVGLEAEWAEQGASPDEIDLSAFCFDSVKLHRVGHTGPIDSRPNETISEDDEVLLYKDHLGRTMKLLKQYATIPLPMDYPVKNMDDWLKIKPRYAYHPSRYDAGAVARAKHMQEQGTLICAGIPGGFDLPRELMGDEAACLAYYDEPELITDIINTVSDTCFRVLEQVTRDITVDNLTVHEDMAGKSGPLVGPGIVREFIAPYYRRIWDLLSERGTRLFSQDSDGNVGPVMDAFIEAGINIFYPMEPAAGMDIVKSRAKYGDAIAYKGGIDKHILRGTRADILKELEYKLQPSMRKSVVFGLDHRIPNGVPIDNFRFYVDTAREMLNLEPIAEAEKGFTPMAF